MSYRSDGSTFGDPRRHRARAVVPAAILLGFVMAGCSGGSGASGPSGSAEPPANGASPSLQLASPRGSGSGAIQTYVGVLGSDSIEGGCTYLQTSDGQKYEVIPPDGWQLQKSPAAFVAPDGQVVARVGEIVTVRGNEADMMSICQLGPIIKAIEITAGGG
jgi:hypothetical protein